MPAFHLAQFNIGRILGPIDSETMAGFVSQLAEINALGDATPGFVWRLKTEDGDATAIRPYDDERIIVNMSVWESLEALHGYVYQSAHAEVLRRRREWFARMTESSMVLWWVPAGHYPTVAEAVARLDLLRAEGPTPAAFTFRQGFSAPDAAPGGIAAPVELPGECPAL
jgi:heme-degrading monooxygenase HmoA